MSGKVYMEIIYEWINVFVSLIYVYYSSRGLESHIYICWLVKTSAASDVVQRHDSGGLSKGSKGTLLMKDFFPAYVNVESLVIIFIYMYSYLLFMCIHKVRVSWRWLKKNIDDTFLLKGQNQRSCIGDQLYII